MSAKTSSRYNSLQTLEAALAEYAKDFKLTSRELMRACDFILGHISNLAKTNRLDCEYLAYKVCQKYSTCKTNDKILLNTSHPFNTNGLKHKLLNKRLPENLFNINHVIISQPFLSDYPIFSINNSTKNSYTDFKNLIQNWKEQLEHILLINHTAPSQLKDGRYSIVATNILSFISDITNEVEKYQANWDSNEHDDTIKQQCDAYFILLVFVFTFLIKFSIILIYLNFEMYINRIQAMFLIICMFFNFNNAEFCVNTQAYLVTNNIRVEYQGDLHMTETRQSLKKRDNRGRGVTNI